jgi:DNA invertase Pin-like site-specific DNA recombinase
MSSIKPASPPLLAAATRRAAAYVRVSTNRQAEHETSLADQVAAITAYCEARQIELTEVFREPGASATDDNRPQFQAMIETATARERPYDLVIVHSFSRFFRDQFEFERYRRKLAKAKVELVSITQDVGEGATGDLVRSILSKFDEYQSAETAKHVRRSMVANARDGFWNGSKPPLGYKVVIAERRGDKDKKILAVDETEAPLVRRIFSLYLEGDGASGPLGIKKIVSWLNSRHYSYRGKPFHVSNVDVVLRRTTYMGTHYFNQTDSRSGERRPREEWVPMTVPPIIDE